MTTVPRSGAEHPWDLDDAISRVRVWHSHDQPHLALVHLNRWTRAWPDAGELWFYRAIFCARLGLRLEEARSWKAFLNVYPHNRLLASLLRDRIQDMD